MDEVSHRLPPYIPPSSPPHAVLLRAPGLIQHHALAASDRHGNHLRARRLAQHQGDQHVGFRVEVAAVHEEVGVAAAQLGEEVEAVREVATCRHAGDVDPQVGQDVAGQGALSYLLARGVNELRGIRLAGVDLAV